MGVHKDVLKIISPSMVSNFSQRFRSVVNMEIKHVTCDIYGQCKMKVFKSIRRPTKYQAWTSKWQVVRVNRVSNMNQKMTGCPCQQSIKHEPKNDRSSMPTECQTWTKKWQVARVNRVSNMNQKRTGCPCQSSGFYTAQWSFPLRISLVNMNKSSGKCGFVHVYQRNR